MAETTVSIIIPVLNEEKYLKNTLDYVHALSPAPLEVIVVDGGSDDNSLKILKDYEIKPIISPKPSRSIQMNLGSSHARGDILVFLHADTTGPGNLTELVSDHLVNKRIILGGFVSMMRGSKQRNFISFLNYSKTYIWAAVLNPYRFLFRRLRILFGDQVMFCRRKDFEKAGGFSETHSILEDAELCLRMNRLGKVKQFPEKVFSSDRRVSHYGALKALWIYSVIAIAWTLGYSAEKLHRLYKNIR